MISIGEIAGEFKDDLEIAVQKMLIANGVDKQSDLVKSVEITVDPKSGMFELIANDYYTYVSTGRKPRARKVPIRDLIVWIKAKRLRIGRRSVNSVAFAIQTAIYKAGIRGKNYVDPIANLVGDLTQEALAEGLEQELLLELDKTFKV